MDHTARRGGVRKTLVHHAIIDPERPPPLVVKPWWVGDEGKRRSYLLQPGEFLLGSTDEAIDLDNGLYGSVEGKSSLGRLGLMIHATAGHVDPGWVGRITLEFFNAAPRPIRLWAGMRVAQLLVGRLSSPSERSYGDEDLGSHYQDSLGTVQAASVKHEAPTASPVGSRSVALEHPV
jgi:dCTP deaminase